MCSAIAPWPARPASVYVESEWTSSSRYLRVHLAGVELHYPSGSWERAHALEASALTLFSPPASTVQVDVSAGALTSRLPNGGQVAPLFISALPSEGAFFALLDVLREASVGGNGLQPEFRDAGWQEDARYEDATRRS